jgi:hypothetical protein
MPWILGVVGALALLYAVAGLEEARLRVAASVAPPPAPPALSWTPLPAEQDISVVPGTIYAAVATVKVSNNAASVQQQLTQRGLRVLDYRDPYVDPSYVADSGYRLVAAEISASQTATLPWKVPSPLSIFDGSRILRAWSTPGSTPRDRASAARVE